MRLRLIAFLALTSCATPSPSPQAQAERSLGGTELSAAIEIIRQRSETPGLSVRVFQKQAKYFEYQNGIRAVGHEEKVTDSDLWHIGSCTKPMTAVLIAKLIDEKKLNWSTKLSQVFKRQKFYSGVGDITIEELLSHRSGLEDPAKVEGGKLWPTLFDSSLPVASARKRLVEALLSAKPIFPHGEKWLYSNSAYVVLGAVVEEIRKISWEEEIANSIFKPLGMSSCGFGPAGASNLTKPVQPWGHVLHKEKQTPIPPSFRADNAKALGPAGTVHCRSDDTAKFFSMLSETFAGRADFVSRSSIEKLLSHSAEPPKTNASLGRHDREWSKGPSFGMAGSNSLNLAVIAFAPNTGRTIVVNTNTGTEKSETGVFEILKLLTEAK